jgi:class 3 adenylate cyclase
VRAALHTGQADLRERDYFGSTVNRCARLRAIAQGGQTLVSAATRELARDHLPASLALHDLGERQLKDLTGSERVYELRAADIGAASR